MPYCILPNAMAPKCTEADGLDIKLNSHMIMWYCCNFRCSFCEFAAYDFKNDVKAHDLTENDFIGLVLQLMPMGKNFKVSGGEPTLNPNVERDLRIIKDLGGTVFFDTNGSNPELVKKLLNQNLIDVLAVSLKGLTPEECLNTAGIKNQKFCWDNPLQTIKYGSEKENVKVIITHVCYNDVSYEELNKFSEILESYPNVFYKINNLNGEVYKDSSLKKIESEKIIGLLKQLIDNKPFWKDRVIYIKDKSAVSNYDSIIFM